MQPPKRNLISSIVFKAICVSGAIATVIWCCYEYNKNEDMCEVYFKLFLEDEWSIYPDITISIPHQLNEEALEKTFGGQINSSLYRKILQGRIWDDRTLEVPIDTVTLNVDDYLISQCAYSSFYDPCREVQVSTQYLFGLQQHSFRFSNRRQLISASFIFNDSVFANGRNPVKNDLFVIFQYPNRLYRSQGSFFDLHWDQEDAYNGHRITFKLKDMEVLRRRNKKSRPCFDMDDYDTSVLDAIISDIGCRPHYLNSTSISKVCNSTHEIQSIFYRHLAAFHRDQQAKNDIPPCTDVQRIQLDYSIKAVNSTWYDEVTETQVQQNLTRNDNHWFEIVLEMQTDSFKEITQKRAYTLQSLIGNLGGYLGIFIGFTLLDLFTLIISLHKKVNCSLKSFLTAEETKSFSHQSSNRIFVEVIAEEQLDIENCQYVECSKYYTTQDLLSGKNN